MRSVINFMRPLNIIKLKDHLVLRKRTSEYNMPRENEFGLSPSAFILQFERWTIDTRTYILIDVRVQFINGHNEAEPRTIWDCLKYVNCQIGVKFLRCDAMTKYWCWRWTDSGTDNAFHLQFFCVVKVTQRIVSVEINDEVFCFRQSKIRKQK